MKRVFTVVLTCVLSISTLFMSTYKAYAVAPAISVAGWFAFYGISVVAVREAYNSLSSVQKDEVNLALGTNVSFGLNLGGNRLTQAFLESLTGGRTVISYLGSNLIDKAIDYLGKESLAYTMYIIDLVKNKGVTYDPSVSTSVSVPTSQKVAKELTYAPSIMPNYSEYYKYSYNNPGLISNPRRTAYYLQCAYYTDYSSQGIFCCLFDTDWYSICRSYSIIGSDDHVFGDTITLYYNGTVEITSSRSDVQYPSYWQKYASSVPAGGYDIASSGYSSYKLNSGVSWMDYTTLEGAVSLLSQRAYNFNYMYYVDSSNVKHDLLTGSAGTVNVIDNTQALQDAQYTIDQNDNAVLDIPVPIDDLDDPVLTQLQSLADKLDKVLSVDDSSSASASVVSHAVDISNLDDLSQTYTDSVAGVFEPYADVVNTWLPPILQSIPLEVIGLISAMMIMLIVVSVINRFLG